MTMNAIALFLALVLHGNPTCASQPSSELTVSGASFQVDAYDCYWRGAESAPSHTFVVWSLKCPEYTGPPVLLKEQHLHKGWAMNEFGEFYPATANVDMMQVSWPRCQTSEHAGLTSVP